MLQIMKKFFVPTAILGWATYYYIEILGKKSFGGLLYKAGILDTGGTVCRYYLDGYS